MAKRPGEVAGKNGGDMGRVAELEAMLRKVAEDLEQRGFTTQAAEIRALLDKG
jgi:hypothetical protein